MNTGVQRSSATPPAARTATTPAVGREPGNVFGTGKNVPLIAMAHSIPYVATASVANLRDLEHKVAKAMGIGGARYVHIHVPCPLGWGSLPADTIKVARLAVESGLFPLFEAEYGEITGRTPIRRKVPVTDYLRLQKRFAHLFSVADEAHASRRFRRSPTATSRNSACWKKLARMDKPFAITLDVGSSLANKTGSWRTSRPVYVDRLPPCNHACPAGENIQSWLYHAEAGDYEAAWRVLTRDNPLPAIMGRVCYHPCETACNRGQLDESVGINSVERFLGDEALKRGWRFDAAGTRIGQARAGRRRRTVGTGGGLPPAAFGHAVTIIEAGPLAGGMMRFGIPKYRLAPRRSRCGDTAHPGSGDRAAAQPQGLEHPRDDGAGSVRRRIPRRRRAYRQARLHTGRRAQRTCWMQSRCCAGWKAKTSRCSAAASSSTAAATPRSTLHAPPSASARPTRSSYIGARARKCRRTISRSRKRCRKAC